MKTFEQMGREQLSKCYVKDGWPKPFVTGLGVVVVCKDEKEMAHYRKWEIISWAIGFTIAAIVFIAVFPFVRPGAH